jgi:hypothetical protein
MILWLSCVGDMILWLQLSCVGDMILWLQLLPTFVHCCRMWVT